MAGIRINDRLRKIESQTRHTPKRRTDMTVEQKSEFADSVLIMSDAELEAMPVVAGINLTVQQKKNMAAEYLRSLEVRQSGQ